MAVGDNTNTNKMTNSKQMIKRITSKSNLSPETIIIKGSAPFHSLNNLNY